MIPQDTIEKVAAANDIVDTIGRYVPLKRAGATFKALCPFHQEKSPSFNVNPARQSFKCFGCGVGGTVFKFITLKEGLDFPAAVRMLAERAGIPIIEEGYDGGDRGAGDLRRRLLDLHSQAAAWFHRHLMKSPEAQAARDYLAKRGLSSEVAVRWQIGYAPNDFNACRSWAESRGFRAEEYIRSGLGKFKDGGEDDEHKRRTTRGYDRFRDRLMFPICKEDGAVVGFSGRVLTADAQGAKYINSPETPIFTKGKVLFGLHMARKELTELGFAIVCEGQIDLITAFEAGVRNVIAPQGTAFTRDQARLLKRFAADEAVLCFDADNAGQQAAERSLPALLEMGVGVRVATMPAGQDPDSLIREHGAMAFAERIAAAQDFFDFQIERLSGMYDLRTPKGKAQFSGKIAESVSLVTEAVLREAVVGKVTARLGISPQDFRSLLKRRPNPGRTDRGPADFRAGGASPDGPAPEAADPGAPPFERPDNAVVFLLRLALENEEARAWLLEQDWHELLPQIAGTELLVRALEAPLDVRDLSETSAFLATLSPAEETFLTGELMEKPFAQPLLVARDSWRKLERSLLLERVTAAESRMRLPDLSEEETTRLQKEVLDLQGRLKDIARL